MTLIKCYECGKEISDKAISCPNCGAPRDLYSDKKNQELKKEKSSSGEVLSEKSKKKNRYDFYKIFNRFFKKINLKTFFWVYPIMFLVMNIVFYVYSPTYEMKEVEKVPLSLLSEETVKTNEVEEEVILDLYSDFISYYDDVILYSISLGFILIVIHFLWFCNSRGYFLSSSKNITKSTSRKVINIITCIVIVISTYAIINSNYSEELGVMEGDSFSEYDYCLTQEYDYGPYVVFSVNKYLSEITTHTDEDFSYRKRVLNTQLQSFGTYIDIPATIRNLPDYKKGIDKELVYNGGKSYLSSEEKSGYQWDDREKYFSPNYKYNIELSDSKKVSNVLDIFIANSANTIRTWHGKTSLNLECIFALEKVPSLLLLFAKLLPYILMMSVLIFMSTIIHSFRFSRYNLIIIIILLSYFLVPSII
jgi:hypothetical protein